MLQKTVVSAIIRVILMMSRAAQTHLACRVFETPVLKHMILTNEDGQRIKVIVIGSLIFNRYFVTPKITLVKIHSQLETNDDKHMFNTLLFILFHFF